MSLTFFAANDGSVDKLQDKMYTEMREAYQLLYQTDIDILFVLVTANTTIRNRFGTEVEIKGSSSSMSKGIGESINWDAADELDFNELWTIRYLDDRFK